MIRHIFVGIPGEVGGRVAMLLFRLSCQVTGWASPCLSEMVNFCLSSPITFNSQSSLMDSTFSDLEPFFTVATCVAAGVHSVS